MGYLTDVIILPFLVGHHKTSDDGSIEYQDGYISGIMLFIVLLTLGTSLSIGQYITTEETRPIHKYVVERTITFYMGMCIIFIFVVTCTRLRNKYIISQKRDTACDTEIETSALLEKTATDTNSRDGFFEVLKKILPLIGIVLFLLGVIALDYVRLIAYGNCLHQYQVTESVEQREEAITSMVYHVVRIIFTSLITYFCCTFLYKERILKNIWPLRYGLMMLLASLFTIWIDQQLHESREIFASHVNNEELYTCNGTSTVNLTFSEKCKYYVTDGFCQAENIGVYVSPLNVEFCLLVSECLLHLFFSMGNGHMKRSNRKGCNGMHPHSGGSRCPQVKRVLESVAKESISDSNWEDKEPHQTEQDRSDEAQPVQEQPVELEVSVEIHIQPEQDAKEVVNAQKDDQPHEESKRPESQFQRTEVDQCEDPDEITSLHQDAGNTSSTADDTEALLPASNGGAYGSRCCCMCCTSTEGNESPGVKHRLPLLFVSLVLGILYIILSLSNVNLAYGEEAKRMLIAYFSFKIGYWFSAIVITLGGFFVTKTFKSKQEPFTGFQMLIIMSSFGYFLYYFFSLLAASAILRGSGDNHGNSHHDLIESAIFVIFDTTLNAMQVFCQVLFMFHAAGIDPRSVKQTQPNQYYAFKQALLYLSSSNLFIWSVDSFFEVNNFQHIGPVQTIYYTALRWEVITHITYPLTLFFRFNSFINLLLIYLTI